MTRAPWWTLPLLALLLAALGACGFDRFEARGWAGVAVDGDTLYVTSGEGRLFALNVAGDAEGTGGRPALLYNPYPAANEDGLGPAYSAPVLGVAGGEDALFVVTYQDPEESDDVGANVYALNAATGVQAWSAGVPGRVVGAPTAAGASLLVGTEDGSLHALALPEDPTALPGRTWAPFQADDKIWSQATVANGTVYFGTLGHSVYAVDQAEGGLRWRAELGGAVVGRPLVVDGLVVAGALDRTLYALDAATGEERWRFEGDGWFWASPVHADGVIYAPTLNGSVYALTPAGAPVWSTPAAVSGPVLAAPAALERAIVVATTENIVHQLNRADGREEWSIGVGQQVRADMARRGEVIYLVDTEGVVHALHTGQRRELWTYPTQQ